MIPSITPDTVVVLDVDDTLYLERDYVRSGFVSVGAMVEALTGVSGIADTLWAGFLAGVRGDAFNRALATHGLSDELVPVMIQEYRNHRPDIDRQPDADALLQRLVAVAGLRIAVITDGPQRSQQNKVEALGLVGLADPLVLTSSLGPECSKPNPTAYTLIEDQLGVDPQQCWYIADNPTKDFVTPQARGWVSIRIRRPESLHVDMATPSGVHEVLTLDDLVVEQ